MILFDALVVNFAYYFALLIRFYISPHFIETEEHYLPAFEHYIPYNTVLSIVIFIAFRLYSSRWKYAGIESCWQV